MLRSSSMIRGATAAPRLMRTARQSATTARKPVAVRTYSSDAPDLWSREFERLEERVKAAGLDGRTLNKSNFNELLKNDVDAQEAAATLEQVMQSFANSMPGLNALPRPGFLKPAVTVAVTGAAGQIGYSMLFRIASGEMLGKDQPINLRLLEVTPALKALEGVVMEIKDCAFPLINSITATDKAEVAFEGAQYAMLVGAKPRGPGMERADLLKGNAKIFSEQGKALNAVADRGNFKAVVVGNPANTNALIAAANAPDIPATSFTAMTKLDHNRALAQLADKANVSVDDIYNFAIWGNHSPTMYPDISHADINGVAAGKVINDAKWVTDAFWPSVRQRGAEVIKARGASSAASAASAAIDHMRDWTLGTNGRWTSMAVPSDGSYGVAEGIVFSFPVVCDAHNYTIVQNLSIDKVSAAELKKTEKELLEEKAAIADLLP